MATDIHGIGFKTTDQIAQKVGIPVDSLVRACAGLNHVVLEATGVEANTIHRLLEVQPAAGSFTRHEANPLDCDFPVVEKFGWQFRVRDKVIQTETRFSGLLARLSTLG